MGRREKKTTGQVLSELARRALTQPIDASGERGAREEPEEFLGFRPFPSRGGIVTNEQINRLRDEDIY